MEEPEIALDFQNVAADASSVVSVFENFELIFDEKVVCAFVATCGTIFSRDETRLKFKFRPNSRCIVSVASSGFGFISTKSCRFSSPGGYFLYNSELEVEAEPILVLCHDILLNPTTFWLMLFRFTPKFRVFSASGRGGGGDTGGSFGGTEPLGNLEE